MKIVYKIYHSCLAKDPAIRYSNVMIDKTPDFETEIDAEKYLLEELCNHAQSANIDWCKNWSNYYFIQKTYLQE